MCADNLRTLRSIVICECTNCGCWLAAYIAGGLMCLLPTQQMCLGLYCVWILFDELTVIMYCIRFTLTSLPPFFHHVGLFAHCISRTMSDVPLCCRMNYSVAHSHVIRLRDQRYFLFLLSSQRLKNFAVNLLWHFFISRQKADHTSRLPNARKRWNKKIGIYYFDELEAKRWKSKKR